MKPYLFFISGPKARGSELYVLNCKDDGDADARARALTTETDLLVEVWDEERFVARKPDQLLH